MRQEIFDHADDGASTGLFDIVGIWWRQRGKILLLAATGLPVTAAAVLAIYVLRPAHQEASVTFRLLFAGADKGQYPDGTRFSPSDLVATPVLEAVYQRDELARYIRFDDFKSAFAVVDDNPAIDRLRREYQDRLAVRTLTPTERAKLESDYASRAKALQSGEFTLKARLGEGLKSWPATLGGKVINDILAVWADQSRSRGVFNFDLSTFSDNILPQPPFADDYPVLLDRLRISINRIYGTLQQLSTVPGARLIRVGERQVSLGDLDVALQDDLQFNLRMIEAPVYAMGFYRNPVMSESYIREQMFRLQLAEQEARSRADAVQQALVQYTASRPGTRVGQNLRVDVGTSATAGSMPASQISDSFLDRVVELASQSADVTFRQDLSRQALDVDKQLAGLRTERQLYERMLKAVTQHDAVVGLGPDEKQKWQQWVDGQVTILLANLKRTMADLRLLNQEIAQRSLQPSMVYTIVTPLSRERVSSVGMRTVALATGFAYVVFLGLCLVGLAWRALNQSAPKARAPISPASA